MAHDFIVVGSGPSGAMAAQTLVESGAKVLMLDVGVHDDRYEPLIPDADFLSLRASDPGQHRYLLGDTFEGVTTGSKRTGPQVTPPRRYMFDRVDDLLPYASETFEPVESLARGGLGSGWGLGCYTFSEAELDAVGLDTARMAGAYRTVARRIGVSGTEDDDAARFCARGLTSVQPASALDAGMRTLLDRYHRRRGRLNRHGFYLGRPLLALLTKPFEGRRAMRYRDMDFFSDRDRSAYRPWITVDRLRAESGFEYRPDSMVLSFSEGEDGVTVRTRNTVSGEDKTFACRRLILAAGVLGTARIVIRSLKRGGTRLPILSNPYSYMPFVQWRMLGRTLERRRSGFCQLVLFHDPRGNHADVAMASLYTYRSLMLFRLIAESPLGARDSRVLMQYLQPSFVIAGLHQPERPGPGKHVELIPDPDSFTGDRLEGEYLQSDEEERARREREGMYRKALRALGCLPIRTIRPPHGASIHYGGTLPFSDRNEPFRLARTGRLHGTRSVYVGDGSGFRFLPAKGVTFTLMANAHVVAENARRG